MTEPNQATMEPYWVDLEIPPEESPPLPEAANADSEPLLDQHAHAARDALTAAVQFNLIHNHAYEVDREPVPPNSAGIRHVALDSETIAEFLRTVVPPPGIEEAEEKLVRAPGLVLHGPAECGLKTTAVLLADRLSRRLRQPDRRTVEVIPDPNVPLRRLVELSETRVTFLYDLTRSEPGEIRRALDDMLGLEGELKARVCHVIVLARPGPVAEFAADRPDRAFEVTKPDSFVVLRRHLAKDVPDDAVAVVERDPELRQVIAASLPARAARIAQMVNLAHRAGTIDPTELLIAVRGAFSEWRLQLRAEAAKGDGRRRSLLLAASFLEESDPGLVVKAADRLMYFNQLEWVPQNPLAAPSVVTQLDVLQELHFDAQDVRFTWPEFGLSVLRYTWQEHPDLRPGIRSWLAWLPAESSVAAGDLARVVDRVAILAEDTEDTGLPLSLAQRWVSSRRSTGADAERALGTPGQNFRRSAAVRLLATTAMQPNTGRAVRAQLYDWAYRLKGDVGVQLTVAEVCGGRFGAAFPTNALTRLKHLAASESPSVRRAVVASAVGIAREIALARALDHLSEWLSDTPSGRNEAMTAVLTGILADAEIVGPHMSPPSSRSLRTFWAACFARLHATELTSLLRDWMRAAAKAPVQAGSTMVEAMVDAVRGDIREASLLWWIARRVSADLGSPRSEELFALLLTRLDELDPLMTGSDLRKDDDDGR